jgi:uncharacterized protein
VRPLIESMSELECWQRVGRRGVGRIGYDAGSGPRIHPVDYTSDGTDIYVLTSDASELARFTRLFALGGVATFEVDQLDFERGDRWSVLFSARVVEAGAAAPRDLSLVPATTPRGQRDWWVRLRPRQVTGRRLV